jgi:VWFA-related protein
LCRNARHFTSIVSPLSEFLLAALATCVAQQQAAVAGLSSEGSPSETVPTFHASTHMVTLELVARDHQGRPVKGLSANDFRVLEQATGWRKEKREQKIAVFKPMGPSELPSENAPNIQASAGVYTNLITAQTTQAPPTILLVDGLNTEVRLQMQVHAQMVRMLRSLPSDVPVAIFLLGNRLRMLQSFTTDPALLKSAPQKASAPEANRLTQIDPSEDPDSLSAMMERMGRVPPDALKAVQRFEQETYASTMDVRVQETVDALASIARHVAGYPGRKNLLWISSSFPLTLIPDVDGFVGFRQYETQMRKAANALAEAKVAVYPIDPAGVEVQRYFQSDTRLRSGANRNPQGSLNRESIIRMNLRETMEIVAGLTCPLLSFT